MKLLSFCNQWDCLKGENGDTKFYQNEGPWHHLLSSQKWPESLRENARDLLKNLCVGTRTDGFQYSFNCNSFSVTEQNDTFCPNSQVYLVPEIICSILTLRRLEDMNRTLCVFLSRLRKSLSPFCPYVLVWLAIFSKLVAKLYSD